jgi:hypothetical protein
MGGEFGAEMVQQGEKEILIDLPGAVLIGVGQGGMFGGFGDAEMDQFALAGLEAFVDFAEALRLAELAEKHGHELVPAAEAAGVAFALVATDDLFEKRSGDQMEKLAENAGYLRQGGVLVGWSRFLQEASPYPNRASPFRNLS